MKKITLFTFLITSFLCQAQVSLVKDINPGSADGVTDQFIKYNNILLFTGNNSTDGFEVWTSDGTTSGTNFITSGNSAYDPKNYYYSPTNNMVYYSAGGSTFSKLYKTDGTLSGTALINGNVLDSSSFLEFNNTTFFLGRVFGSSVTAGKQMLSTDGTNTPIISFNGGEPRELATYNGLLYFSDSEGSGGNGYELWVTDGTASGTNHVININATATNFGNAFPRDLTVFNNKLYFTADNGINGRELWVTDGTVAGTQMVLDLNAGATGSNPENLTVFNNALYFTADHPTLGTELFKMATTQNITLLKNIASGSGNSNPSNLFVSNGKLYFSADDGTNGRELWSSTGFSSTTIMLKNINTDAATPDSNPDGFTEYFGELYFAANDGVNGRELWKTDGTDTGTVLVDNINPSGDSNPQGLTVANNRLFFSANDGTTGIELWKYQDPTLSIIAVDFDKSLSLFPNPTKDVFTIKTTQTIQKVVLYDIKGKIIKSFDTNFETYPIDELASGIYFVKIKSDRGAVTKKLIKN